MKVSIFVPSTGAVAGGVYVMYQYANLLARRGHEVHVGHMLIYSPSPRQPLDSNADWFDFDAGIHHHWWSHPDFPRSADEVSFGSWDSDVMIGQTDFFPGYGLPSFVLQGRFAAEGFERLRSIEGPIACVSKYMVEVCAEQGVAPHRTHYLPNAVHPAAAVERGGVGGEHRGLTVGFQYHPLSIKGTPRILEALRLARQRVSGLRAIGFGQAAPDDLPDWIDFVRSPDQARLAEEVYRRARVFVCASDFEAFGLTSLEAMACGSALVTTDTMGSRDFAFHGETAMVSEVGDDEMLARNLVDVLTDDQLHRSLTTNGRAKAVMFNWDRTGDALERMLLEYLEAPDRYRSN